MSLLEQYQHLLCDLDGCLISGNRVLPGAQALVAAAGPRLIVVSNNSTDTPTSLSAKLNRLGLPVSGTQIVLAGTVAIDSLASDPGVGSVHIFGTSTIIEYARSRGLTLSSDAPTDVLLTRDLTFGYERLQTLLAMLKGGARLTVANIDKTHPGIDGVPVPETGALLAAVQACLPQLAFRATGKPEPHLFNAALGLANCKASQALMIGDNPATDAVGAQRAGIAHVLIGDSPEAIAPDLAALLAAR